LVWRGWIESAGSQGLSMDNLEEFLASSLELLRRLVVADLVRDGIEYFKGHAGFQTALGAGWRFELVVGRHQGLIGVDLALLAVGVGAGFREEAGPMEVEVGVEVLAIEVIDQCG